MIRRFWIQLISSFLTNSNIKGFFTGKIYTGFLKYGCVPTLNCYSCPGALFSCPVGAAQVVLASGGGLDPTAVHTLRDRAISILSGTPVFVIGFLSFVGALIGRASCGWFCPFGFLQDLLYRLPSPKLTAPKFLRDLKYLVLLGMVILMPLFWIDKSGIAEPSFCKLLCPAGTLEGGILLPLFDSDLRQSLGKLFAWKFSLLVIILVLSILFSRAFCSWLCPLGAFLSVFNFVSIFRLSLDPRKCVHCGICNKVCPSQLKVEDELDNLDCIRCLECSRACPKLAICVNSVFSQENPISEKDFQKSEN